MNKRFFVAIFAGMLAFAFGIQGVSAQVIVDAKWVSDNKDKPGFVVIDVRTADEYKAGHVPGAINIESKAFRGPVKRVWMKGRVASGSPAEMKEGTVDTAKYEKLLGDAGVSDANHIILVGTATNPTVASVPFWVLELLGMKDKVHYLDGGFEAWKAAGYAVETVEKKLPATKFTAKVDLSIYASTKYVYENMKNPDIQIVDARTPKETAGADIRALRGGHIPAATYINIDHVLTFDKATGKIKTAELPTLYGKLAKDKEVVAYCQSGTRSTLTYTQLRSLGFTKVRNYDDSWMIWGNNFWLPVASETFFDTAGATKDVAGLKKDVKDLGKAVADVAKAVSAAESTAKSALSAAEAAAGSGLVYGAYIVGIIGIIIGLAAITRKPKA